jgi:hypothetical protein
MPVGLLAKLVAFVMLAFAAVGIFVGGQFLAACFDKLSGPKPPTVERTAAAPATAPPAVRPTPPETLHSQAATHRATPTVAHPAPPAVEPSLAPRPTRGALRPRLDTPTPAPPPRSVTRAPPPPVVIAPTIAPARDSTPVVALNPAPRDSAPAPSTQAAPVTPIEPPPHPTGLGLEPVLVDLQLGRLVSRTVPAFRDDDEALVPLRDFFDLAEIGYSIGPEGVLEARLEPSGELIRVAPGSDSVSVGKRRLPINATQLVYRDSTLFIATERLGAMFDLNFDISWPDLTVTVLNPDSLPVGRRMWRDQMRALLAERQGVRPDTTFGPAHTKWDGLVFDYNVAFPVANNLVGGSSYQFGMGAQVAGGALEIGLRSLGTTESGATEFAATWKGVWVENKYVKQLTLGTATLTGPRYAGIRGVAVTNSPYIRPSYVGQLNYYGRLDPGWQLEAYSGAQLVAFDSIGANGDYSVTLPVGYGENAVDFVAYGPTGQVRRFNQTYRVVSEQLPYKQFEYGIAAGECVSTLCTSALNADVHYGVSRRVTVRAGVEEYWRDNDPDLLHPYGVVTGLVGNAITLEGEAVGNGWLRGAARFEPSTNFRIGAGYSAFDDNVVRPVIAPPGRRSQWLFDAFLRPIPVLASFYLQGLGEIDQGVDFDATRMRLQASVQAAGVRLYPYARYERLAQVAGPATSGSFVGLSAYAIGAPSWGPVMSALWFRGDLEAGGGNGWSLAAASLARSFGPALRIEAGAAWHRGIPGTVFTFSLVSYLPTLQASTTAIAPTEGAGSVIQTAQGSLIYDGNQGRLTANPNPGLQRSGVSGRVFLDQNSNGLQDPGEPGVGGVRVIVGSFTARSDSLGRYHVWDIPAFDPVNVQIDSTSLDNPLYVPAFTSAMLSPPPNAYREFNLPLVTGAVLEGRVLRDGAPLPGVTLVLTNRANGKKTAVPTFSDGTFYVLGVKPGRYTLEVDPRDLAVRHLTGGTLTVTAQPDRPDQLSGLVVETETVR